MKILLLTIATALFTTLTVRGEEPLDISLVQLIANPKTYDGKKVRVVGYLHHQFEDSGLYFSKEDADYLNGKNAVWISYSNNIKRQPEEDLSYFDCKYVLIEGVFDKNQLGHMGAFSGTILDSSRIMEETRWFDGRKQLRK